MKSEFAIWGFKFTLRTALMIVAVIALVGLGYSGLRGCQNAKTAGKEAELSKRGGEATLDAVEEAGNTVANVAANAAATDATVAQGRAEIAAAPEAGKAEALRKARCRLKPNRNKPECKP